MKILLVDNHDLILDGLSRLLKSNGVAKDVIKTYDANEAFQILMDTDLDLVITDYRMPGMTGLELLIRIKDSHIETPVVFVSMVNEPSIISNVLNAGAHGFINKESTTEEMVFGIQKVLSGNKYLCRYSQSLLKHRDSNEDQVFLTRREVQVLRLIVDEKKNQQIAKELHINVSTVETHKKNLIKKLNVKSSLGLVKYALEHRLF